MNQHVTLSGMFVRGAGFVVFLAGTTICVGTANADDLDGRTPVSPSQQINSNRPESALSLKFECGILSPAESRAAIRAAVDRGEIVDPRTKPLPAVAPGRPRSAAGPAPCIPTLTADDIFLFEDSAGLLLTNFSNGQLFNFMTDAANTLIAVHGDNFDFIGFWVNFTPDHTVGTAFHLGMENDVNGIGRSPFNRRGFFGLGGENVESFIMMWNINSSFWEPGTGTNLTKFTRTVLGQEFEHRFAMFLPDLLDGRRMQGDGDDCGRGSHWNFKVDGQGSGMEIREWIGSPTASFGGDCVIGVEDLCLNSDIGGVFSYTDLYLMGYVTPAEMDTGNSELRYMNDNATCASPYSGTISSFSSADIVSSAGLRIPTVATSQKNWRTGWVMIHRPGDPPDAAELSKALGILEQHTLDWNFSTVGKGTMSNSLSFDCNCNTIADRDDLLGGSPDCNGNGSPDECDQDCDADGMPDDCQITADPTLDCDTNGFIDSCDPTTRLVHLSADFEGGLPAGWSTTGIFQVTNQCAGAPVCNGSVWAYAGSTAACTHGDSQSAELISPPIALPLTASDLRYCSRLSSEIDFDFATVRINGTVVSKESGGTGLWESRVIDLSPYAGQTITIAFLFYSDSSVSGVLGWQVDRINVVSPANLCVTPCADDADCNDSEVCTFDQCIASSCSNAPNKYGDVDHDGDVDLFDLFCILNGFAGDFSVCSFKDDDLEPCKGDADIDLFDLFAVLNAFSDVDPCCGGLP